MAESMHRYAPKPLCFVHLLRSSRMAARWRRGSEVLALDVEDLDRARRRAVTTSRFTRSARETAQNRRPTITLIDGDRLADLCLDQEVGVVIRPVANPGFFDRFE